MCYLDPIYIYTILTTYLRFFLFARPTTEIVRLLLTRAASSLNSADSIDDANADDILSVTSLHYWGRPGGIYAQRFAEILSSMITSSVNALRPAGDIEDGSGNTGGGRKRAGTKLVSYLCGCALKL